jgi:methanogenic corrinoid protein MtbC1
MQVEAMLPKYVEAILSGNRSAARDIIRRLISTGVKAHDIYRHIFFPSMEQINERYREDRISVLIRNMAVRINRFLTDQVQAQLMPKHSNGKSAIILCAETESEELGGQMCADLLEADGWQVFFLGGGVAEDEVTEFIGNVKPDLLVIYGSTPSGVPQTRELIIRIRDIGLCPGMNVLLTGGIFNRVEGLWEELRADLFAADPIEMLAVAYGNNNNNNNRRFVEPQESAAPKRRRRLVAGPISIN